MEVPAMKKRLIIAALSAAVIAAACAGCSKNEEAPKASAQPQAKQTVQAKDDSAAKAAKAEVKKEEPKKVPVKPALDRTKLTDFQSNIYNFKSADRGTGPVLQTVELCYQQKKKLSACGGKAKGKDWNMAEAIKFGTGVSKFVKSITVKNGVVTLTSKNTNEKDVTAELTKIYIPSPVDPKDPSKGLSWEVDAANSTCAPLGAC